MAWLGFICGSVRETQFSTGLQWEMLSWVLGKQHPFCGFSSNLAKCRDNIRIPLLKLGNGIELCGEWQSVLELCAVL